MTAMTALAIQLRLAHWRDAHALALMSRELVEVGMGWRYRPAKVARLIEDPDTVVLVACERPCLVGFSIMEFGEETAHLVLLAVQRAHQRRGIGRRMVQWLLESAATAGIATIHLEVRAGNPVAREFYHTLGFAETKHLPNYYQGRESAIRMVRSLRVESPPPLRWPPPTLDRR
jgi:ribosomal protein S18 acetylase RimI-like enzyme